MEEAVACKLCTRTVTAMSPAARPPSLSQDAGGFAAAGRVTTP
jgi:hypothetical protein